MQPKEKVNGAFHILSLAYNIPCRRLYGQVHFAQGQLESHFGTEGIAAKTNMVWNVGAFDNKSAEDIINDKNKNTAISHPDKSIEPYIRLLYSTYLVDGKTEKDMFIKYVDKNGKRYASNPFLIFI